MLTAALVLNRQSDWDGCHKADQPARPTGPDSRAHMAFHGPALCLCCRLASSACVRAAQLGLLQVLALKEGVISPALARKVYDAAVKCYGEASGACWFVVCSALSRSVVAANEGPQLWPCGCFGYVAEALPYVLTLESTDFPEGAALLVCSLACVRAALCKEISAFSLLHRLAR